MFFLAGLVGQLLASQFEIGFAFYVLAVLELVLLCSIANMATKAAKRPARLMHEWALAENEKITISGLKGKTTEELEKLLQYHMEQGNIEAADRISQKMLNMVDGMADNEPIPLANPVIASMQATVQHIAQKQQGDPGVVLKMPAGTASGSLPSWMQDGSGCESNGGKKKAAEEEPQQQSSLPDWMS